MASNNMRACAGNTVKKLKLAASRKGGAACFLAVIGMAALFGNNAANATPTALIICKSIGNNGDARSDSATFNFLSDGGALNIPNQQITAVEAPAATQCTTSIPLAGATSLSVTQSSTVVAASGQPAWAVATGSYSWTATGTGLTGASGSTQTASLTPAQFLAVTGTVKFTFTERRQRLLTRCVQVEDNLQAPAGQGGVWTLAATGAPDQTATATEGSGLACGAPTEISSATITFGDYPPGTYLPALGYPKIAITQTDNLGTPVTDVLNLTNGSNYAKAIAVNSLVGDITVIITNRYSTNRTVRICSAVENTPGWSGNNTISGSNQSFGTVNTLNVNYAPTVADGGIACTTSTFSDTFSNSFWTSLYANGWTGNATGYPKWEMYIDDGNNTRTGTLFSGGYNEGTLPLVSNASGSYIQIDPVAIGNTNIKLVIVNSMGPYGNGSNANTGDILKFCNEVLDNGDGVTDKSIAGWTLINYGTTIGSKPLTRKEGDRACSGAMSRIYAQMLAGLRFDQTFMPDGVPTGTGFNGWPGDDPLYPRVELRGPIGDTNPMNGGLGGLGTGNILVAQNDATGRMGAMTFSSSGNLWRFPDVSSPSPTLRNTIVSQPKGDMSVNFMNLAAPSRILKSCFRVEDNGIPPNNQTVMGLTEGSATGACISYAIPSVAPGAANPTYLRNATESVMSGYGFVEFSETKSDGTAGACKGSLPFKDFAAIETNAVTGILNSQFNTPASLIDKVSNPFYAAAGSVPCTENIVNVNYVVRPAPLLQACIQVLDNGDGTLQTAPFNLYLTRVVIGPGSGSTAASLTAVTPVPGGALNCVSLVNQGNGLPLSYLAANETLSASYGTNATPGYPRWELRGSGRQDAFSVNGINFGGVLSDMTGCPSSGCAGTTTGALIQAVPNINQPDGGTAAGLQKITNDGNLTFIFYNRLGADRYARICQQINDNADTVVQNTTASFVGRMGSNGVFANQPNLNESIAGIEGVAVTPFGAVQCSASKDITTLDPGANTIEYTQTLDASFVSAVGYPQWKVFNTKGTQVASGTGSVALVNLSTIGTSDLSVVFINQSAPSVSNLLLQKEWVNARAGEAVSIPATTGAGPNTTAFDAVSAGNNVVSGTPVSIITNGVVNLPTEVFNVPANAFNYFDSGWFCQDGTNPSTVVKQGGSFTIPVISAGKTITCTLTNTGIVLDTVKSSVPASGQVVKRNDVITYTLSTTVTGSNTKKDIVLTDTLGAGLTAGVMPSGCQVSGQLISCALPAGSAAGVHNFVYTATVNNNAVRQVINQVVPSDGTCSSCTTTHTLQGGALVLEKKWSRARVGETVTIPAATVSGVSTSAFDAVSQRNNTVSGAPFEIFLGDSVQLPTEVFQVAANAANYYDAGWVCQDGTNPPNNVAQGGSFVVPLASADKTLICTLTNTRIGVDAIKSATPASGQFVNKGDVISYKLSVTVTGSSTKKDIILTDTMDAGLTAGAMPGGCTINGQVITCTLPAGSSIGVHDYLYTATVNNAAIKQVNNQLAISYGICSSCSTTHTLQTGNLLLQKKWLNAAFGETVSIPATAIPGGNTLAFDAVSQRNNIVSGTPFQVLIGDSIILPVEVFKVPANAANYSDSGWLCQDGTNPPVTVPQGSIFTIPLASSGKAIICTLTNTAITVDTVKSSLPASGQVVRKNDVISYTLSATVAGGSTRKDIVLTDTLDIGLTPGAMPSGCQTGGQVITCTLPAGSSVGVHSFVYSATVNNNAVKQVHNQVAASDGTCSSCSTTHILQSVSMVLGKQWINAKIGEVVTIPSFTVSGGNIPAFDAVSQGNNLVNGVPFDVSVGESVNMPTEVFSLAPANASNYQSSGWVCQDGKNAPVTVNQGANFTISAASAGLTITCTLTNTGLVVDTMKTSVPASGQSVSVGDTITYTLSTVLSGNASPRDIILSDTTDAGLTVTTVPVGCQKADNLMTCSLPAGTVGGTYNFTYTAQVNNSANVRVNSAVQVSEGTCNTCQTSHPLWSVITNKVANMGGNLGVRPGDVLSYTVTSVLTGAVTNRDLVLTDTVGPNLTLLQAPPGCSASGQVMTCTVPAGSAAGSYSFNYSVNVGNSATNFVQNTVVPNLGVCGTCSTSTPVVKSVNLLVTKTTVTKSAKIADFVRYEVTIENPGAMDAIDFSLLDQPAPGLSYVSGSMIVVGSAGSRVTSEYPLTTSGLNLAAGQKLTLKYLMRVGSSAGQGLLQNCAQVSDIKALITSNRSCASIVRTSDPDFEDNRILGTVFEDTNGNGIQDEGEPGIPGVRLGTVEGFLIETDAYGRYHIEGIDPGRWARGRNFIVKVDEATLPEGAVATTQNPLVRRLTPGLPAVFNFGFKLPARPVGFQEAAKEVKQESAPETIPKQAEVVPNPLILSADGLFEFDRFDSLLGGKDKLILLANQIQKYPDPNRRLTVVAYTDRFGSDKYNIKLSIKRAQAIKDFLGKVCTTLATARVED